MKNPIRLPSDYTGKLGKPNDAFSLMELLVTVAIVCILAVLVQLAVKGVMKSGQSAKCLANMRGITAALLTRVADSTGRLPVQGQGGNGDWPYLVSPAGPYWWNVGDRELFCCPFDKTGGARTYSLNQHLWTWDPQNLVFRGKSLGAISRPARTFLLVEAPSDSVTEIYSGSYSSLTADFHLASGGPWLHENRGSNYAFVDGHVAYLPTPVKPGTGWFPSPSVRTETFGAWMAGWGVDGWDNY